MKSYPHIATLLYATPWLITRERHLIFQQLFEQHIAGIPALAQMDDDEEMDWSEPKQHGETTVIPIHGVLGKHLSSFEMMCGGCDVDQIGRWIDGANANWSTRKIALDIRSPGGVYTGIPELGDKIKNCPKPIQAFSDSECCSGAIWLASQAKEFYCSESATIGSVGVYSVFTDRSEQLKEMGVKIQATVAGKFKLAGAPWKPLTDEELAMFQERTDGVYERFKAAILSNRSVDQSLLQGQCFYGDAAVRAGFVDGIFDSLDEMLEA